MALTLFTSQWKTGKTTLLAKLLQRLGRATIDRLVPRGTFDPPSVIFLLRPCCSSAR